MKALKLTVAVFVCIFVLSVHPVLADDPTGTGEPWTFIEESGNGPSSGSPDASGRYRDYYGLGANGPGYGSSLWTYADSRDSTRKTEGSYAAFLAANGFNPDGSRRSDSLGTYSETATFSGEDSLVALVTDNRSPRWLIAYAEAVDTDTLRIGGAYADATATADITATGFRYTDTNEDGPPGNYSVEVKKSARSDGTEIWLAIVGETRPTIAWLPDDYTNKGVYVRYTGLTRGPHSSLGGVLYATTGNRCKVCHAAHRAGGAFKLMRSNSAEDACSYCHVDDHRHASRQAYTSDGGLYTANGHTIGAGRDIPSSSVRQWLEPFTLTSSGGTSWTIRVRRYDAQRLKLFVYTAAGSSGHNAGGGPALVRYGPTLLSCVSCHQPHNASSLVWKPAGAPAGYKLLRASPSGSLLTADTSYDPLTYNGLVDPAVLEPGAVIRAPETSFGAANTGHNLGKDAGQADSQTATGIFTTWTQWKGSTETVSPQALSVWCADCHNLEMAANETPADSATAEAFRLGKREKYGSDRTHTSGTNLTPCYACHRASGDGGRASGNSPNWEPTATPESIGNADCDRCHYRPGKYSLDNPTNDFPHSGAATSTKLLFDWYDAGAGLDQVCRYCHNLIGG